MNKSFLRNRQGKGADINKTELKLLYRQLLNMLCRLLRKFREKFTSQSEG